MIQEFHFIRPGCFLFLFPLFFMWFYQKRLAQYPMKSWYNLGDIHLIKPLICQSDQKNSLIRSNYILISVFWIIFSMAGPSWFKYPIPIYSKIMPNVVVLEMSDAMLMTDLKPTRLQRAKFKLNDFLNIKDIGQVGLVVFTSEPFVVSPLTEDSKTIESLIENLSPVIMPVSGYRLDLALTEAADLIKQAGYKRGNILVMTASAPNSLALKLAKILSNQGIQTSVMPILPKEDKNIKNPLFEKLASMGNGIVLGFTHNVNELSKWSRHNRFILSYQIQNQRNVPSWRDEGRWFLIPALIFLLPAFRKGALRSIPRANRVLSIEKI